MLARRENSPAFATSAMDYALYLGESHNLQIGCSCVEREQPTIGNTHLWCCWRLALCLSCACCTKHCLFCCRHLFFQAKAYVYSHVSMIGYLISLPQVVQIWREKRCMGSSDRVYGWSGEGICVSTCPSWIQCTPRCA